MLVIGSTPPDTPAPNSSMRTQVDSPILPMDPVPPPGTTFVAKEMDMDIGQNRQWFPRLDFPKFDSADAMVWLDKCCSYFTLYHIPAAFRVTAASLSWRQSCSLVSIVQVHTMFS